MPNYARSTILTYNNLIKVKDIKTLVNISIESYEKYLVSLKKGLSNLVDNKMILNIIKYNNDIMSVNNEILNREKNTKKENDIIKTIFSYIYRGQYKMVYGAFSNFYSKYKISKNKSIAKSLYSIIENIKYDDEIYINPCNINNLFFNITNGKNTIIRLKEEDMRILKEIIKNPFNQELIQAKGTFINAGILKHFSFKFDYNFEKKIKKYESYKLDGFKNQIFNIINKNLIYVPDDSYSDMVKSCEVFLNLLNKQFEHLNSEKKIFLNDIKKRYDGKVNLLQYVYNNISVIEREYLKRSKFNQYFLNELKIGSKRFDYKQVKYNLNIDVSENKYSNIEAFVSSVKFNNMNYYLVDSISPIGVFSSRIEPVFDDENSLDNKYVECIFDYSDNPDNYHTFRRNKYTDFVLNINLNPVNIDGKIIDINDVFLEVKGDNIQFYSKKYNKYFEPVFHTTLPNSIFIISKFIKMISYYQSETYSIPNIMEYFVTDKDYVPRLLINNLIVQKRTWKIYSNEININFKFSLLEYNNFINTIKVLLDKNIPRYINIFNNPNEDRRIIDIHNPYSLMQLKRYLVNEYFYIEEVLPNNECISDIDLQNDFLTQYLICL
ncbi:MAG: hypothetical protein FWF46_05090 [Oscillospiraceae bacterium]|nr:hypothetical protein [Oscillospiraceae bacterium]